MAGKFRKYDILPNELKAIYGAKVYVISYVITWDGVVTKCHKKYIKALSPPLELKAYIQTRILQKTLDSISLDFRRGTSEIKVQSTVLKTEMTMNKMTKEEMNVVKKVKMVEVLSTVEN